MSPFCILLSGPGRFSVGRRGGRRSERLCLCVKFADHDVTDLVQVPLLGDDLAAGTGDAGDFHGHAELARIEGILLAGDGLVQADTDKIRLYADLLFLRDVTDELTDVVIEILDRKSVV